MPDSSFVARIAELLEAHPWNERLAQCGCEEGFGLPTFDGTIELWAAHVAEVLVASLHTQEAEMLAKVRQVCAYVEASPEGWCGEASDICCTLKRFIDGETMTYDEPKFIEDALAWDARAWEES